LIHYLKNKLTASTLSIEKIFVRIFEREISVAARVVFEFIDKRTIININQKNTFPVISQRDWWPTWKKLHPMVLRDDFEITRQKMAPN